LAIVVVGGSTKNVGKTALVCGVIAALREFDWTAVKITAHDYEPAHRGTRQAGITKGTIWEETSAGAETDTARYLVAGARRALLVTRYGAEVAIEEIRRSLGADRNVIFESNGIVDALKPDVCLALVGGREAGVKASFLRLLRVADALVSVDGMEVPAAEAPAAIVRFELQSADRPSPEMVRWLRERLTAVAHR
jgi:hypothetical protein